MMTARILRVRDAARRLGVSMRTLRRYCEVGILPATQLPGGHWRIDEDALARLQRALHDANEQAFRRRSS